MKNYRILQIHNFYQIPGGEDVVVRNEKRLLEEHGHKVYTDVYKRQLLEGAGAGDGGEIVRESAYLRVRKLLYHIDRAESQDGSRVCSGWAFAKTWDGRCLPVNIRVAAPGGEQFAAEITRRARADVAEMFKLRRVENPEFGFDCVWQAAPEQRFCLYFSLGNRESIYEG